MRLLIKISILIGTFLFWGIITFGIFDKVVMPIAVKAGRNVPVPDIIELDTLQAQKVLAKVGFELIVDADKYDQNTVVGAVTSQNPPALSVTKPGRRIHVLVSKGPEKVAMIDVTGISLRQAKLFLHEKRLEIGTVKKMYSSKIPRDVVVKQSIIVDSLVSLGTLVDLTVSVK